MVKLALIVATVLALVACGAKKESAKIVESKATSTGIAIAADATDIEMLTAMGRAWQRTNQICANRIGNEISFFIDFKKDADPEKYQGWYYIKKINFYPTQNKGWFLIDEYKDEQFVKAYPDVNGLVCKLTIPN
jgi:hypothetical protein